MRFYFDKQAHFELKFHMVLQGTSVLQLTISAGPGTNSSAQSELHETDAQCGKSSLGGARKQLGLVFWTNPEQSEWSRNKLRGRERQATLQHRGLFQKPFPTPREITSF